MDYSSSLNDADNPAGASPWGSSPAPSPHHRRSLSQSHDAPSSPSMPGDHNRSESSEHVGLGGSSERQEDSSHSTNAYDQRADTADSGRRDGVNRQHDAKSVVSSYPPSYHTHAHDENQPPYEYAQGELTPEPSRPATRQGPQYKLVAKITGLERTGRKDPILRFDVHVSSLNLLAFHFTYFEAR